MKQNESGDLLEDDFVLSDVEDNDSVSGIEDEEPKQPKKTKKKKQIQLEAPQPKKKAKGERETDILELSQVELVNYFWEALRKAYPQKSSVELEQFQVKDDSFLNTDFYDEPHTINNFSDFVKKCSKDQESLSESTPQKGAPLVLVITPSAIRATSVIRALREVCGKLVVGKLFAKHMKIPEQQKFLENFSFTVGVGTPNRIEKLVELGYLNLNRLELIIIDLFKDTKNRNLFNIPECSKDFFELYCNHLTEKVNNDKTNNKLTLKGNDIEL